MDRGALVLVVESCLTDSLKLHNPTKKVIYNPLVQEKGNVKSKAERERERERDQHRFNVQQCICMTWSFYFASQRSTFNFILVTQVLVTKRKE